MQKWLLVILLFPTGLTWAQQLTFPDSAYRHSVKEGQIIDFKVAATGPGQPKFTLEGINGFGIQFDSIGNFHWEPSFDLVDRLEKEKEINLIFQAEWKDGAKIRKNVNFTVYHQNRPPHVDDLPVFYVKQSTANRYQISLDYVHDDDGDPIVFKALPSQMPEGATLSPSGVLEWKPSHSQFASLKNNPLTIEFIVQDQPDRAEATGKVKIAQTQLDLPPEMFLVPGDTLFTIKEDERVNFKVVVSDPNGDDNISSLSFVASDPAVPANTMIKNSPVQAEFTWSPGYNFVSDVQKMKMVDIFFYAIDKSNNKVQRKVRIKILDAENLDEKDKMMYSKYRTLLMEAKVLIDQLDNNQKKLNKEYRQAKKGKKNRAVVSAGVGGGSGISGFAIDNANVAKVVSGSGGVVVGAMGTLEATEVIGRSKSDILDRIKTNTELRNQLQVEGDNFSRKFALKSVRRENSKEFDDDKEKFMLTINSQRLATLELDASRPNYSKVSDNDIRKTFSDFASE